MAPSNDSEHVPSPQWGNRWVTIKTLRGFNNSDGTTCYRNATLQMLFHLPIFLNWAELAINSHIDSDGACLNENQDDESDEEDANCKLCLLKNLINAFWSPRPDNTKFYSALDEFWQAFIEDWTTLERENGADGIGQQDALEFISELVKQLQAEVLTNSINDSLGDIFSIEVVNKRTCSGVNGCGANTPNIDSFDFLTSYFTDDENSQAQTQKLEETLENSFAKDDIEGVCTVCRGETLQEQLVITELPEVLLVLLNRIGERDEDSGETELFKIQDEIEFPEELVFRKEWLAPELGDIRKDVKYALSSVLLHQSETPNAGHYMAVVKSQDGTWTLADDTKLSTWGSFEAMAGSKPVRETAYLFEYRRLPLVTRGPSISLKESLQNIQYSVVGPSNSLIAGGGARNRNTNQSPPDVAMIDTSPPKNDSPQDIMMTDTSQPKVAQQNDETEIELQQKQCGNLEIKFTTLSGVTTLNVHIKGMLWNDLMGNSGGPRSITRRTAYIEPVSDAVIPKPIKVATKPTVGKSTKESTEVKTKKSIGGEIKKSSPKPAKKEKRHPEESTRKSGRIAKVNTGAKKSVRE
ncbi:uncharacterized protein N7496_010354 [Penicillium cataractarum]|uniref:ubiquitinyl hydrolase 1 n=1 Tax=Penicillium cataractarum TaxID=2100454 RepID=A0A9W9RR47_9EURO|nr:uncharacterized protein N7496_010354 [Penicillium cataractarum]KAJ5364641.1 hypothetical protein N7496_010354 [Penicillium cataractarum]